MSQKTFKALLWGTALLCAIDAQAIEISILDSHYSADLSISSTAFTEDGYETTGISKTFVSSTPLIKKLQGTERVFANASATPFMVSSVTSALYDLATETNAYAASTAKTSLSFQTLSDGLAPLTFDVTTNLGRGRYFTGGLFSLYDLSLGQSLLSYEWTRGDSGNVPWPSLYGDASVSLDPMLFASHQYVLTMSVSSDSNVDAYGAAIRLAGLTAVPAVPEPGTYALMLMGLVAVATAVRRRKTDPAAGRHMKQAC